MKGYTGKVARINLATGDIKREEISEEFCRNWIGGYGMGIKVVWDEVPAGCDPLSPDNVLVFNIGPFPGTILPTSSKYGVFAKSPLTGLFGMAISSGSVGAQMRRAGWNMVILEKKAPEPVYIMFDNDDIQIQPCSETLWGKKDSWETEEWIRHHYHDERIGVSSIGKAGEIMVRIACLTNDRNRQAGRTGMGAVMGSKNVKALAFRGTNSVEVAHPKEFYKKGKELIKISMGPVTIKYRDLGTPVNVLEFQKLGILPTRNFQSGVFEHAFDVSGEKMAETWVVKKAACSQCPIGCDHLVYIKDGPYKGAVASVDYECSFSVGSNCGIWDMPAITRAIELCDRHTIDGISAGVCVSFAMEAFENNVLTPEQVGYDLKFGDGDAMVRFIEDICLGRTEAGKIIGLGSRGVANYLGQNSMHYAMQVKGLEMPGYVVRGIKTAALGFAVAICGGCHLRNGAYQFDIKGDFDRFTQDKPEERVKKIINMENDYALIDSYIICKFTRGIYKNGVDEQAEVYSMVTGIDVTGDDLRTRGAAIHNLAKCYNLREGATKADDYLPERDYTDPLPEGPSEGQYIDRDLYTVMLDAYYSERGWDSDGVPTQETLDKYGLSSFVNLDDLHPIEERRYMPCL